jgi:hypothetical protein
LTDLKVYTDAELIAIGRKVVEGRRHAQEKNKERQATMKELFKLYQEGKITIPGNK